MVKSNVFFEALFNRDISAPGTKEFLTNLAEEHPYFTSARFFLLKQTAKNTDDFNKQLSRTSALFNNNYWLNYLLLSTDESNLPEEEKTIYATEEYNDPAQDEDEQEIINIQESIVSSHRETEPAEETTIEKEAINTQLAEEDTSAEVYSEETSDTELTETITAKEEEITVQDNDETGGIAEEGTPAEVYSEETSDTEIITAKEEEIKVQDDETGGISEEEPLFTEGIIPLLAKINLSAADTKEDTLIFEPLHVTDYFASVGIKLSDEIKPADKLGHQLKSFTEWLKTMKKVHSMPQLETSQETEQQIQQLAEKSNVNGDVITESMADVLVQQGRVDKAIEMLEKLSLLNPSKSAYFAAKITTLKE